MRPPDVPEVLIAIGLLAIVMWGIYNWAHRQHSR